MFFMLCVLPSRDDPNTRHISLSDRAAMPYTDAVLHEVLRHSCLVYVVPHATTEDTVLSEYTLPKYVFEKNITR